MALQTGASGVQGSQARAVARTCLSVAAAATATAAAVHIWVIPEHLREWWPTGAFFAVLAAAQAVWAVSLLRRPSAGVLGWGAAGTLGVVALYAWSRTAGLPVGPGEVEEVGRLDLATTAFELISCVAVGLAWFASGARPSIPRLSMSRRVLAAAGAGLGAVILVSGFGGVPAEVSTALAADARNHRSVTTVPESGPSTEGTAVVYTTGGDLFLYDVASDSTRRLTNGGWDHPAGRPRFRDANTVTFGTEEYIEGPTPDSGGTYTARIVDLDLRTGVQREVLRSGESFAAWTWSPARDLLATLTYGNEADGPSVHLLEVDTGEDRVLRTLDIAAEGRCGDDSDDIALRFSPDGSAIVVTQTAGQEDDPTMWVVGLDGLDRAAPRRATHPVWSPDSRRLYYRDYDGEAGWMSLDVAAGATTPVQASPATHRPALSPDGRLLALDDGGWSHGGESMEGSAHAPAALLYDLESGTETRLGDGRVGPLWLSPTTVALTDSSMCEDCMGMWEPAGTVTAVDVRTGESRRIALGSTLDADTWFGSTPAARYQAPPAPAVPDRAGPAAPGEEASAPAVPAPAPAKRSPLALAIDAVRALIASLA